MEQISRTRRKNEALSLQTLGEQLVKLSTEQLKNINMPADIHTAVTLAKTLKKHGARLRQMQYIGTLMRKHDPAPIQEALQNIAQGTSLKSAELKRIEKWRDELIAGNDQLKEELLIKFPQADRKQLTELVTKAREDRAKQGPSPQKSRTLYRYLKKFALQPTPFESS
jgi:ribosome-associated protein